MAELLLAVDALVAAAMDPTDARPLKRVVESVLDSFPEAPKAEQARALLTIGRALPRVKGRGAQILSLALGALVEGGASADLSWPIVAKDLRAALERATTFAEAVVAHADDTRLDAAMRKAGAAIASTMPVEAESWKALPSRCLAAIACLTRSKKVRARARRLKPLAQAAWPLSDAVAEVGQLFQALRIVDDEIFVVIAPTLGRAWRVVLDEMPSNAELHVMLADALLGKGLPGKRPPARLVAAIREGRHPRGAVPSAKLPFALFDRSGHAISVAGIPADIPPGPGKERVIVVQPTKRATSVPVVPSFEELRPTVRVKGPLSAAATRRLSVELMG